MYLACIKPIFMKSVKETLLTRTSVRRYTREPLSQEQTDFIFEAIRNSPTSYNGQQFSVVAVSDVVLKEELYALTGQKQIKTCALFLVFCADYHKLALFARHNQLPFPRFTDTLDGVLVGVIDAAMAMQNAATAAHSQGLGSCCIGYTRTAAPKPIAELLGLPEGVFVVCGLSIGHPAEFPEVKPKQPVSMVIHGNHYRSDDMAADLQQYNALITEYNCQRAGDKTLNDWGAHILNYHAEAARHRLEGYLADQGFHLQNAFLNAKEIE